MFKDTYSLFLGFHIYLLRFGKQQNLQKRKHKFDMRHRTAYRFLRIFNVINQQKIETLTNTTLHLRVYTRLNPFFML